MSIVLEGKNVKNAWLNIWSKEAGNDSQDGTNKINAAHFIFMQYLPSLIP